MKRMSWCWISGDDGAGGWRALKRAREASGDSLFLQNNSISYIRIQHIRTYAPRFEKAKQKVAKAGTYPAKKEIVSVSREYETPKDGGTMPPKTPVVVTASTKANLHISPR